MRGERRLTVKVGDTGAFEIERREISEFEIGKEDDEFRIRLRPPFSFFYYYHLVFKLNIIRHII